MPRIPKYIVANWKMNLELTQVESWLHTFDKLYENPSNNVAVVIAPSTPYLLHVQAFSAEKTNVATAAQDLSENNGGSYTGQVGAFQLNDFVSYCVVGHSETKNTKSQILKKRDLCLQSQITPIVCFSRLKDGVEYYKEGVILAWENPATISVNGQYRAEDPVNIEKNLTELKAKLPHEARIIYGGSVNRQNAQELANIIQLDGVLIGNASLDPHHFFDIVRSFAL